MVVKQMSRGLGGYAIIVLALVLTACASSAATPTPATPTPAPTRAAATTTATRRAPTATAMILRTTPTIAAVPTVRAVVQLGQRTKTGGCQARGPLPDPDCTPGSVFATATAQEVCAGDYAASVRFLGDAEKAAVYGEYGITSRAATQYEVDYLVPLELGGANDIANLWPEAAEPRPGYHEKDTVENLLRDQVCAGRMALADAQKLIATEWTMPLAQVENKTPRPATATAVSTAIIPVALRGVPPLDKNNCPSDYPIKGNRGSPSTDTWIYHLPGGKSYNVTDPEECFGKEADAVAAGYRRALP